MRPITLHYNAHCADCVRRSKVTGSLDWFRRIQMSTGESPIGEPPKGEVVVVDHRTGQVFTGVYAMRKICMQVPLMIPMGLLLYLPPVRALMAGTKPGCNGDACEI